MTNANANASTVATARPEQVHARAARHGSGARVEVGSGSWRPVALTRRRSARIRSPSAAITKKISEAWTNAKASKTARLTPKAGARGGAGHEQVALTPSRRRAAAPKLSHRSPHEPEDADEADEAEVDQRVEVLVVEDDPRLVVTLARRSVRSRRESALVTPVPSARPSIGLLEPEVKAGPRSAIRPEPSSPARRCCSPMRPPWGVNEA